MTYTPLSQKQAEGKLKEAGLNQVETKTAGVWHKLWKVFASPMTLMLFAASGVSYHLNKIFDVFFILGLVFVNIAVSLWHEKKADDTLEKLKNSLAIQARVLRGKEWKTIDSKFLVPDDIIRVQIGSIAPADFIVLEAKNFSMNESSLTGESLPVEKQINDTCFAGTFVASGVCTGRVTATGKKTRFGQTLITISQAAKRSLMEEDILNVAKFLTALSLAAIFILSISFYILKKPLLEMLELDLSLLIAGVPVALPTVMTLITSIGIFKLAKNHIIVRNIESLEDLSNVNLLLSDKTGTLTENVVTLVRILTAPSFSEKDVIQFALAADQEEDNPIEAAVFRYAKKHKIPNGIYPVKNFIPFDPDRKRSTAWIEKDGKEFIVSFGAPQVIEGMCLMKAGELKTFTHLTDQAAAEGYRTVSVAIKAIDGEQEEDMQWVGSLLFSDVLSEGSKSAVNFMRRHGIETKMVTGDSHTISARIAFALGLKGDVLDRKKIKAIDFNKWNPIDFKNASVFSEVSPTDKYHLVEFAKQYYRVAVTGDGINDIPPVRAADVGIAVFNAVDALKSSADIVITSPGIGVIRDAIIEARKIFARLTAYSTYRISESARVIFATLILGLLYDNFPLLPIHLIILALLNDIPIVSLAYDRVEITDAPSQLATKNRAVMGALFGGVGVFNSILLVFLLRNVFQLDWPLIQTLFFLKLSISGHLLIYVTHTKKRWFRFLPSKEVIWATTLTQLVATAFAYFGLFMQNAGLKWILLMWLWAIVWMQIGDLMKRWQKE